jgi:hypothetical protein
MIIFISSQMRVLSTSSGETNQCLRQRNANEGIVNTKNALIMGAHRIIVDTVLAMPSIPKSLRVS